MNSPYAYVLETSIGPGHFSTVVFTWPNIARKYIRDTYTTGGQLRLPPPGRLRLTRHKVNPKAGTAPVVSYLNVEKFMAGNKD